MSFAIPFDNSYARLPQGFYARLSPEPVCAPRLIAYNKALAAILGIPDYGKDRMARIFSGSELPEGSEPLAQLYAGHQFGHWTPQLGDGRAILLGETVGGDGKRRDIQLKGCGRTPFSRMGDGRAWLGPVLREYVVSEAMHAMGISTTRALAAVETGESVFREAALPGAVLTRVATSHMRVGTFQVFAARGRIADLRRLTEYAIARHYPDAAGPMGLLRAVVAAQAELIPSWMAVGFVHGVMNTDNCSIAGETMDYGPCAFLDDYHPRKVFSSIDRMGRYAFSNQPEIAVWNMAQFATALIQQMDDGESAVEEATDIVHGMRDLLQGNWLERFRAKLGLSRVEAGDSELVSGLLERMAANRADFTNTFRNLGTGRAREQFVDPVAYDSWEMAWRARCDRDFGVVERLRKVNPARIPRNHRIEQMISAALHGDFAPFERLNAALAKPFDDREEWAEFSSPPRPQEIVRTTFCGT